MSALQVVRDPRNTQFRNQALWIINYIILGKRFTLIFQHIFVKTFFFALIKGHAGIGINADNLGEQTTEQVPSDSAKAQDIELLLEEYLNATLWNLPSVSAPGTAQRCVQPRA